MMVFNNKNKNNLAIVIFYSGSIIIFSTFAGIEKKINSYSSGKVDCIKHAKRYHVYALKKKTNEIYHNYGFPNAFKNANTVMYCIAVSRGPWYSIADMKPI